MLQDMQHSTCQREGLAITSARHGGKLPTPVGPCLRIITYGFGAPPSKMDASSYLTFTQSYIARHRKALTPRFTPRRAPRSGNQVIIHTSKEHIFSKEISLSPAEPNLGQTRRLGTLSQFTYPSQPNTYTELILEIRETVTA